jgi:FtsP/CotA-like multicopper oxidase with cupredoxin domain
VAGGAVRRRWRIVVPILASVALIAPLVILWQASLVPRDLSVHDMGYPDYGGGAAPASSGHSAHHGPGTVSVETLVADPTRKADVLVNLVAASATLSVGPQPLPGFTINGTSPGPTITAEKGQLVEVRLRNESVPAGVALHWHGLDVPNAMDGVAGVTQDAVPVGGEYVYRFVAEQVGTYWYHSHQVSHEQVIRGLFGAVVITPVDSDPAVRDVLAVSHVYPNGVKTLNGQPGNLQVPAKPGERVRLRLVSTDNGPVAVWTASPYRVLAVDGYDVHEPGEVRGEAVILTAGGRLDLGLVMPADGSAVRVQVSKGTAVILGAGATPAEPVQPLDPVDLLDYGTPAPGGLGFDPAVADRRFDYRVGYRPGFVRGRPGLWWSINGHLYPDVPMYMVREGDVVVMRIDNRSGEVHPMHLHGHHAVVLSRNGVPAAGSPWWVDSLNVENKEMYEIAFVASNPGIWMDHCHNLRHAAEGFVAHLMYEGVTTPYTLGGPSDNHPE